MGALTLPLPRLTRQPRPRYVTKMWEKRFIGPKNDDGRDASRAHLLKFQVSYWPSSDKVKKFLSAGSLVRHVFFVRIRRPNCSLSCPAPPPPPPKVNFPLSLSTPTPNTHATTITITTTTFPLLICRTTYKSRVGMSGSRIRRRGSLSAFSGASNVRRRSRCCLVRCY